MATAYINIGSNIGDRHAYIEQAVAAIEHRLGTTARRSAPYHSSPWGYESDNQFLNLGIAIDTDTLTPQELLQELQKIQHSIDPTPHRTADGLYTDRRIDIDLIAVDDNIIDTPQLQLPHPRMHLRSFVLQPLHELAPKWHHPVTGLTPQQMIRLLSEHETLSDNIF